MIPTDSKNHIKANDIIYALINRNIVTLHDHCIIRHLDTGPVAHHITLLFDYAHNEYIVRGDMYKSEEFKEYRTSFADVAEERFNYLVDLWS